METSPSDRFVVETPENIRFGYDVADIGSRFLAILIDSLIQGVLYILLTIAAAFTASRLTAVALPTVVNDILAILFVLTLFLIQFGYFLFLEIVMAGQTPGKRLFNLRVVKDNGYPLSPLDSIVRNIVRIIDFFPFAYGIGLITMFLNRRAKRLGDFAAGTIVVKMRNQVRLTDITVAPRAPADAAPLYADGVNRLHEQDVAMVEAFLLRRENFTNREQLAQQMAQRLATKMGRTEIPTQPKDVISFLRDTVNEYRRGRG